MAQVTVTQLFQEISAFTIVDVRKHPARLASMQAIPGAAWRDPADVDDWWPQFSGRNVAVYCVHGHEVSRAVCAHLREKGIEACLVEGGFEAWREAGLPVEPIGRTS